MQCQDRPHSLTYVVHQGLMARQCARMDQITVDLSTQEHIGGNNEAFKARCHVKLSELRKLCRRLMLA